MTAKRFRVTISNTNAVSFVDVVGNKQLMSITFKNKSDAIDCKNALMYQCDLLNELYEENKELKLQNGELLYQIGEVGKNNKTCRECECFIPECKYCYMWDMEVEADDVVVACDQRKVNNTR